MPDYDPFSRGKFVVGVHSHVWRDRARDRELPVEVWYPATDDHLGQDQDPATQDAFVPGWFVPGEPEPEPVLQAAVRDARIRPGEHKLVLLVYGWAGYRREATFLGTHLASHGYVVVSPDVIKSTYADVDRMLNEQDGVGDPAALAAHIRGIAEARRGDVTFLIDRAVENYEVDSGSIGITGASFGGWSSLSAPQWDARIGATLPMCPANDRGPLANADISIDWEWQRDVPTLLCVADQDALLPLFGQLRALRQAPASWKKMLILAEADHNHFVDDIDLGQEWLIEFANRLARTFPNGPGDWAVVARTLLAPDRMLPGEIAKTAWRGAAAAHFDAFLRGLPEAIDLVNGDLVETMQKRGVPVSLVDESGRGARSV